MANLEKRIVLFFLVLSLSVAVIGQTSYVNSSGNTVEGFPIKTTPYAELEYDVAINSIRVVTFDGIVKTKNTIGPNTTTNQVTTKALVIVSGGSQFAAAEDGTPLHITYEKVGTGYIQKIAPATAAELAECGKSKADFTPRVP